jgi:hypothetical protein
MKSRCGSNKISELIAVDNVRSSAADEAERRVLIDQLKKFRSAMQENEALDLSKTSDWGIRLWPESSFGRLQKPASEMLGELTKLMSSTLYSRVTSSGELHVYLLEEGWVDVTHIVKYNAEAIFKVERIAAIAMDLGGFVYSDNTVLLSQWLSFHGFNVPDDGTKLDSLIGFLEWKWPETDNFSNYWEQITGFNDASIALTPLQCAEIRALTGKKIPAGESLLGSLFKRVKPYNSVTVDWNSANEVIAILVRHPTSQQLAREYVEALGWWGAAESQKVDEDDLAQVLLTAIVLQSDPSIGTGGKRNCIGRFDIYDPGSMADRPLYTLRENFEAYLVATGHSHSIVPLISHLLLAHVAPGLLVKNLPAELYVGSIGWVTFAQAVSFVEINRRGSSRFMSYEQIMKFANMDTVSPVLGQLQGIAAIDPIVDWALINEVITHENLKTSATAAAQSALDAYKTHVDAMVLGVKAFAAPPPNRKRLAMTALKRAVPNCDFIEEPLLRPEPFSAMRVSLLDLHIEGLLTSATWDWNKEPNIFNAYPELLLLPPIKPVFDAELASYHKDIHKAIGSNIKLAIAGMPRSDREIFASSKVTFFTVRPSVEELYYPSSSNYNLVGVANLPPKNIEVQLKKDQAVGRFGVIMIASYGNNQTLCYEMFTLLGECRRNDALGKLIVYTQKMNMPGRVEYKGKLNDAFFPLPPTHNVPTDMESYIVGNKPAPNASGIMVIEKLGAVPAPTSKPKTARNSYQFFVAEHIDNIARFVVENRPLGSLKDFKDAFTEYTDKEHAAKVAEEVFTYIIDLCVPFKKCIEDLASGNRNQIVDGVYACTMDAIGIFFTVLGAPAKILHIAAKTVSLTAKIGSLVRFGMSLTVSTFNPIDGLPTAGYQASKALFKSVMHLGVSGAKVVEAAVVQMGRLTGTAQDFHKLASAADLGLGKWHSLGSTSIALNVCAIKKSSQWFAVNRLGKPWGKRLVDFDFQQKFSLPLLQKPMPDIFTGHIVERSLPVARVKIDNAIEVLSSPALKFETDLAVGLFLGSSATARDELSNLLTVIRLDFAGTSVSNVVLDRLKVDNSVIEVNPIDYNRWKNAGAQDKKRLQYMTVNTANFNQRFSLSGYDEIADDFVHEMIRCNPAKTSLVTAESAAVEGKTGLDVAPLLNLATGRHRRSEINGADGFHDSAQALANADSLALLVALLSLLRTNETAFSTNISVMRAAIDASANQPITGEVVVNLN